MIKNSSTKYFQNYYSKHLFLQITYYLNLVFHIRSIYSFIIIDRCDDQWTWVFTSIIRAWAKIWKEFFSERLSSERVDMRAGLHIIKGDQTLLIIHKHTDPLRLHSQRQRDRSIITGVIFISIPQNHSPVSITGTQCDHSLSVNGFSGHS